MACPTGVNLHGGDSLRLDLLGIDAACDIALDDSDVELVAQGVDRGQDGRGLARPRTRQKVNHVDVVLGEPFAQLARNGVVLIENGLLHINLHGNLLPHRRAGRLRSNRSAAPARTEARLRTHRIPGKTYGTYRARRRRRIRDSDSSA